MPLTPQSLETKPYNVCIDCVHIGKKCDGPNFLAMSIDRWCEWCHLRKEFLGWTNAKIAELSGVSKISVDRIMSGSVKDLRNTTMQAVTKVLVNGSWGQYPCASSLSADKETVYVDNPALVEKCERLQELHTAKQQRIDFLLQQIGFKEKQMDSKDKLLKERYEFLKRKDRIILLLGIFLGITLLTIIGALAVDAMNPDIGFFWVQ